MESSMRRLAFAACLVSFALPALAEPSLNQLTLLPTNPFGNEARIVLEGSHNTLTLSQTSIGSSALVNFAAVSISGDRNGGFHVGAGPTPLIEGLSWGSLAQSGERNRMKFTVTGSDNLFAALQSGSSNIMSASVSGQGNQAAVAQSGSNNFASFSQMGNGNVMSITQKSW
jgi:hypothetical protein